MFKDSRFKVGDKCIYFRKSKDLFVYWELGTECEVIRIPDPDYAIPCRVINNSLNANQCINQSVMRSSLITIDEIKTIVDKFNRSVKT